MTMMIKSCDPSLLIWLAIKENKNKNTEEFSTSYRGKSHIIGVSTISKSREHTIAIKSKIISMHLQII
jgi:hypothetical protein